MRKEGYIVQFSNGILEHVFLSDTPLKDPFLHDLRLLFCSRLLVIFQQK